MYSNDGFFSGFDFPPDIIKKQTKKQSKYTNYFSQISNEKLHAAKEIEYIYTSYLPSQEVQAKRMKTYNLIRKIVDKKLHNCRCSQYGSIRTGIDINNSDMDISIDGQSQKSEFYKLGVIAHELENTEGIDSVTYISTAKTPIVKVQSNSFVNMDISCRGEDGKLGHLYMSRYVTPKINIIIEICRLVKIWTKVRVLKLSSQRGLSQFSWMCICVFYACQHYSDFEYISTLHGIERYFGTLLLLKEIFNDFLQTNWMESTISPLHGLYLNREEKGFEYNCYGFNQISIESPFHPNVDLAIMLDDFARRQIMDEVSRAVTLLSFESGDAIKMLFSSPYSFYQPLTSIETNQIFLLHNPTKLKELDYFYLTEKDSREIKGYLLEPSDTYFTKQNQIMVFSTTNIISKLSVLTVDDTYFIDPFEHSLVKYYPKQIISSFLRHNDFSDQN